MSTVFLAVWLVLGLYFAVAAYGGGGIVCAALTVLCGLMAVLAFNGQVAA